MSFDERSIDRQIESTAGSYPPVYFVLVGWPSRLAHGLAGLYAMRVAGAALFSLLMALAIGSIGSGARRAPTLVAMSLAATPMVWFLAGSVNPSSAAIAAGFACWCGGYRLVHADDAQAIRETAWRFGLPLCLLLLLRRDSLLWGGLMVVALAALLERRRVAGLVRSPHVIGWAAASLVAGGVAWRTGIEQGASFVKAPVSGSGVGAFGALTRYLQEMVGVLGWLDTALPGATYLLWYLAFGFVLFGGLTFARRRVAMTMAALVIALGVAIVVVGTQQFPYFQGRYALPLAVGVPLLAGFGLEGRVERSVAMRAVLVTLSAAAVIEVSAFLQQLRRYALSGESTWNLFGRTQWSPPYTSVAVLALANIVAAGIAAALCGMHAMSTSRERQDA